MELKRCPKCGGIMVKRRLGRWLVVWLCEGCKRQEPAVGDIVYMPPARRGVAR